MAIQQDDALRKAIQDAAESLKILQQILEQAEEASAPLGDARLNAAYKMTLRSVREAECTARELAAF